MLIIVSTAAWAEVRVSAIIVRQKEAGRWGSYEDSPVLAATPVERAVEIVVRRKPKNKTKKNLGAKTKIGHGI